MKRQFCDRCGADITDKSSAAVTVVGEADMHGAGPITVSAELCRRCCHTLEDWLSPLKPAAAPRKKAR